MGIRWTKKQLTKLKKARTAARRTLREEKKKGNTLLEKAFKMEDIRKTKRSIKSASQLEMHIRMLNNIAKGGKNIEVIKSDRGAIITRAELKNIQSRLKAINRERQKEEEKNKKEVFRVFGEKQPYLVEEAIRRKEWTIRDLTFNFKNKSRLDLMHYKEKTLEYYEKDKKSKDMQYRKNLYSALQNVLTNKNYKELKKVLDKIPTSVISHVAYVDSDLNINYVYDELEEEKLYSNFIEGWQRIYDDINEENSMEEVRKEDENFDDSWVKELFKKNRKV